MLAELVTEANYADLINKPEQVNSVRILQLLSKAEQHTEQMQGKEIIAFFGSTGSGKSTTVNYFVGHELEIKKNKFGEQVVHLVESESKSSAKIGHSIGTSETIFSEGLPLLQEKFDQESDVFPKL